MKQLILILFLFALGACKKESEDKIWCIYREQGTTYLQCAPEENYTDEADAESAYVVAPSVAPPVHADLILAGPKKNPCSACTTHVNAQ